MTGLRELAGRSIGARGVSAAPWRVTGPAPAGVRLDGLVGHRLAADLERYASEVELVVLPTADLPRVQPTHFSQAGRLMLEAHVGARAALALPAPATVAA